MWHDFTGTVTVAGAPGDLLNVEIYDETALDLGAIRATGTLDITVEAGSISNSGDLDIDGAATFTAPTGSDIIVDYAGPAGNTFDSTVTFVGKKPGGEVRSVAPQPDAVTLGMHQTFVRLPDDRYRTRAFDPCSGSFEIAWRDYAAPLDAPLDVRLLVRHRLVPRDPDERPLVPVKPIVYHLDRGAPEPVRTALLEDEVARLRRSHVPDREAADLYLRARYLWYRRREGDMHAAIALFEQAIEKDPEYPQPHAGIAEVMTVLGTNCYIDPKAAFARVQSELVLVFALDDSIPSAHACRAMLYGYHLFEWEPADESFRRAIELDPNWGHVKCWYAGFLNGARRLDEAAMRDALHGVDPTAHHLLAFPAQSNFSGVQHRLDLVAKVTLLQHAPCPGASRTRSND